MRSEGELGGIRVLLVEDADDVRGAFGVLLGLEGAEVAAVRTGREAVDLAARRPFDILLTDLGLPDIPGDRLIREILATGRCRPRIVVVTGYGEPYVGRARAAGADAVFTKPVEWAHLLRELRKLPHGAAARARAVAPTSAVPA
ncbi:MAG TPA: response regulator [Candidatus Binatia bacterium]|nr:response regulator [Candidatus Binatia bacterium]